MTGNGSGAELLLESVRSKQKHELATFMQDEIERFATSWSALVSPGGRIRLRAGGICQLHRLIAGSLFLQMLCFSSSHAVVFAATSSSSITNTGNSSGSTASTTAVTKRPVKKRSRQEINDSTSPIILEHCDPLAPDMSAEAIQLADLLGLTAKLRRLIQLNKEAESSPNGMNREAREERTDLKLEVLETVEESRLQIDCVQSEIEEEEVVLEEARRLISDERDKRVNRANQTAFRTNGVLWAVAEALDIPTYKSPRLSIPSGAIGIVAGIVPSIFSGYATRSSSGGTYRRKVYPNMLTKMFDLPTIPRVDYPGVVWLYLNANPPGETRSRKEIMQDRWRIDSYIHFFEKNQSKERLLLLTGNEPYTGNLDLVTDKLIMMGQIKAVTLQMSRPLLEICMVVRGKKQFANEVTH